MPSSSLCCSPSPFTGVVGATARIKFGISTLNSLPRCKSDANSLPKSLVDIPRSSRCFITFFKKGPILADTRCVTV